MVKAFEPVGESVAGAVLAGGASRRMGTDKAFVTIDDVPLVVRAVAALTGAGIESVAVIGGDEACQRRYRLTHVPDRHPGEGPLGGIITALEKLDASVVMILCCDLIEPSPAAVRLVLERASTVEGADVVVPFVDRQPQWLHAAWRRACLPALRDAFAEGKRAPRQVALELDVETVTGPAENWFRAALDDADRPDDIPETAR